MLENGRNKTKWKFSWYLLTILGCLIPGAVLCSVYYTFYEMRYRMKSNRAILYCAIGAIVFSVSMTVYEIETFLVGSKVSETIVVALIFSWIQTIYLFCAYLILLKRAKRLQKCLFLVQIEHITSVAWISEILGISVKRTVSMLKWLIRTEKLDGAEVGIDQDEIWFSKSVWAKQKVICKSCGANLVVNLGQTLVCEYCGGALEVSSVK